VFYSSELFAEHSCLANLNQEIRSGTAGITVTWTAKVSGVERPHDFQVRLQREADNLNPGVQFAKTKGLTFTGSNTVEHKKKGNAYGPGEMGIYLTYPRKTAANLPSLKTEVTATLTDGAKRSGIFTHTFVSRSPRLGPGLTVRAVWPGDLIGLVLNHARVRSSHSSVSRPQLEREWRFDVEDADDTPRRRAARRMRLRGLRALEDGDIEPRELDEILNLAQAWANTQK